jgi:hypothetical protein
VQGRLGAKGYIVKNGELQEHEEYIPSTYWKVSWADRYNIDMDTAVASRPWGVTYENVSIGKNIRFKSPPERRRRIRLQLARLEKMCGGRPRPAQGV